MDVSVDTSQVDAVAAELAAAGPKVAKQSGKVLDEVGEATRGLAQQLAPKLTGALAASIDVTGTGMERVVGTGVPYAIYVEFGTYKDSPQPFMGPAGDLAGQALAAGMADIGDPFA